MGNLFSDIIKIIVTIIIDTLVVFIVGNVFIKSFNIDYYLTVKNCIIINCALYLISSYFTRGARNGRY